MSYERENVHISIFPLELLVILILSFVTIIQVEVVTHMVMYSFVQEYY